MGQAEVVVKKKGGIVGRIIKIGAGITPSN